MVIGYTSVVSEQKTPDEEYAYNRFNEHYYPEGYLTGQYPQERYADDVSSREVMEYEERTVTEKKYQKPQPAVTTGGPMDSPWPMHCHDARHTGRSPYSTINNSGFEKWRVRTLNNAFMLGSPVIDNEGTIYTAGYNVYAINSNGTIKWAYDTNGYVWSAPAIDEDGTIYVGTVYGSNFYAFNPNGTLKWKIGSGNAFSSPAIGNDGTIYYCDESSKGLKAIYPNNGTRKWIYHCNHLTMSSPAIGLNGTIYFGSIDSYVYAVYPNGTLKWKFSTGTWVHGSATIGDDGTVYIGSDYNLYALNPYNGTMKWKLGTGAIWSTPVIDKNGIIYVGSNNGNLYAVYPNGTVKWVFATGGHFWFGPSPAISTDGTIYFGTTNFGGGSAHFFALNSDGAEKWRFDSGRVETSPSIGEDETVYITSWRDWEIRPGAFVHAGYLHALNNQEPNAPSAPEINGQINGNTGTEYEYTFKSTSPLDNDVYYYIEWSDGDWTTTGWIGPYNSGEEITLNHTWKSKGTYTIKARAKDTENLWGPWGELEVTMPKNKQSSNMLFIRFLEGHPRTFPILRQLFGL